MDQKQPVDKVQLTDAQSVALRKMPHYFILEQLSDRAVVIAFEGIDSPWMVVTTDGRVFSFEQYLSKFD